MLTASSLPTPLGRSRSMVADLPDHVVPLITFVVVMFFRYRGQRTGLVRRGVASGRALRGR